MTRAEQNLKCWGCCKKNGGIEKSCDWGPCMSQALKNRREEAFARRKREIDRKHGVKHGGTILPGSRVWWLGASGLKYNLKQGPFLVISRLGETMVWAEEEATGRTVRLSIMDCKEVTIETSQPLRTKVVEEEAVA